MTDNNNEILSSQTLQLAQSYYASGQVLLAENMYRKVLQDDPGNVQSLHMLSLIAIGSGRYGEAVEWVDRAIKIRENDPVLFFTQGLALQEWGELDQALLKYKKVIDLKPDYIQAHLNIGHILEKQGRFDEAELRYRHVIVLQPGQADPIFNLAAALKNQKKFDEAAETYKKVIVIKPDYVDAYYNLGNLLKEMGKIDEAAAQYAKAIALKPDMAEACYNLGNLLRETGKPDEAAAQYVKAIALKPDMAEAYYNLGLLLNKRGMLNEEVLLFERLLTLQPDNPIALVELVHYINEACAWGKMGEHEARLLDMVRQEREGVFPSIVLQTNATAEEQLVCSRSFMRSEEKPQGALFTHDIRKSSERIKIGYLSHDYREHATAYLMAELFERHDRSRFNITAYSFNPSDNSPMRERLVKAFDRFVDVCDLSDREAAQKIYDDGIDILIDLKGLTGEARTGIPAYRPAPVQVNYLGYPGTMGASFIDYIIADRFIIPEDQERFYSERVICLPDCYQPNDTHRRIAGTVPTRKDCGLPDHGFVFCCFNINLKIKPRVFDIWMRLLQKVPDSVLWLFESNLSVKGNLRQKAVRRGVNPERIIFAPRMPLPEHLARHQLADLFLDTLPINAHTTTSDALWAGLPVLTCVGTTFAGRVAGSLLKAANLPELITYSLEEYETLALQLAQNPAQLKAIRQKLQQTRLQVPLFDIGKFTKNIEKSYQTMWDIWQAGDNPKAFTVS